MLDDALEEAGIDRGLVYITNVVKHFKYEKRGKRRIHKKPNAEEIRACRPWLDAELSLEEPTALVCLGATAAQTLIGRTFEVTLEHGNFVSSELAPLVTATVHPSSILRAPDEGSRRLAYEGLVSDLAGVSRALDGRGTRH